MVFFCCWPFKGGKVPQRYEVTVVLRGEESLVSLLYGQLSSILSAKGVQAQDKMTKITSYGNYINHNNSSTATSKDSEISPFKCELVVGKEILSVTLQQTPKLMSSARSNKSLARRDKNRTVQIICYHSPKGNSYLDKAQDEIQRELRLAGHDSNEKYLSPFLLCSFFSNNEPLSHLDRQKLHYLEECKVGNVAKRVSAYCCYTFDLSPQQQHDQYNETQLNKLLSAAIVSTF